MKRIILFIVAAALTGCAAMQDELHAVADPNGFREKKLAETHKELDAMIEKVIGKSIDHVIANVGAPNSVAKLSNGDTIQTWTRSSTVSSGGNYVPPVQITPPTTTSTVVGSRVYSTTTPGTSYGGYTTGVYTATNTCSLHFRVDPNGIIKGGKSDCR